MNPIFSEGTAEVAQGGTTVVIDGSTKLAIAGIRAGDQFKAKGLLATITDDVTTNTQIKIRPWPGENLVADVSNYEILRMSDANQIIASSRIFLSSLSETMSSFSALDGTGGDKGIYLTGPQAADTYPLTAYGRSLVASINSAEARTKLEAILFRKGTNGGTTIPAVGGLGSINMAAHGASAAGAPTALAGGVVTFDMPWTGTSGIARSVSFGVTYGGSELWWTGYDAAGAVNWRRVSLPSGGTVGQILQKQSSTHGDAAWVTPVEEVVGSFTPSMRGETTAGSPVFTDAYGRYHKIGKRVWFNLNLRLAQNGIGGMAGNVRITGLPFPVRNESQYLSVAQVIMGAITFPSGKTTGYGVMRPGVSELSIGAYGNDGLAQVNLGVTNLQDSNANAALRTVLFVTGTYITD